VVEDGDSVVDDGDGGEDDPHAEAPRPTTTITTRASHDRRMPTSFDGAPRQAKSPSELTPSFRLPMDRGPI
jgi:hypothetical protein